MLTQRLASSPRRVAQQCQRPSQPFQYLLQVVDGFPVVADVLELHPELADEETQDFVGSLVGWYVR